MHDSAPSANGTSGGGAAPRQPLASTSTQAAAAYLAAPFISSKALVQGQSTVQEDPVRPNEPSAQPKRKGSESPQKDSDIPSYLYSNLSPHHLLPDGTPDYLRLCLSADIYNLVKTTPLQRANNLSAKLGCEIYLKREDLQPVFSFKLRGAYNLMRTLEGEQKWKGVIACSAGNHAQGVSLSGLSLSIPCTIVMPLGTPTIKVSSVRALGAKVVLHGQDFDEAKAECNRLAQTYGLKVIPPFDDPHVIAGQGTVAVEMLRQTSMDDLDGVFCCVGGGGLLAGVASYTKRICSPRTKVFGVETFDGDALSQSLEQGQRVTLKEVGLFADGTAVKVVGEECWRILRQDGVVDGMVRVDTDEICAAIRDTFEDTRTVPEPSGALSLAGLKRYILHHNLQGSGKKFACVVSGANMNFSRFRFVAERAEVGDGKEVLMMVEIPEKPGSFQKLHSHLHPRPITEFSYRYNVTEQQDGKQPVAHIYLSFLLNGQQASSNGTVSSSVAATATSAAAAGTGLSSNITFGHGGSLPISAHNATPSLGPNALASRLANSATLRSSGGHHVNGGAAPRTEDQDSAAPSSQHSLNGHAQAGPTANGTSASVPPPHHPSSARERELQEIMAGMAADGIVATDISSNEMAKSHGRYLVGGHQRVPNERLFRFEFPERPGALRKFLAGLNIEAGWNISLFHYRNHGSDIARILAGLQVPRADDAAFQKFLDDLGYSWTEETDNEVARRFL
ncbi:unnamed protein product [Parajaminaea phylloscopi]